MFAPNDSSLNGKFDYLKKHPLRLQAYPIGSCPLLTTQKSGIVHLGLDSCRSFSFLDCQVYETESLSQSQPPQKVTGSCTSYADLGNLLDKSFYDYGG